MILVCGFMYLTAEEPKLPQISSICRITQVMVKSNNKIIVLAMVSRG
jgi:hypothetical protein